MKHKIDNYVLGDTDDVLMLEKSEEHTLASQMMAQQSSRTIEILSQNLDPVIYNTVEFTEAIKRLVLKSKYVKVRVLVHDPQAVVKRGHRLVNLAMHLSSYIEIRVPSFEHANFKESIFIADTTGFIHRINPERFEGKLNFNDKRTSRILLRQFDAMWEKSRSDPNFKRALL